MKIANVLLTVCICIQCTTPCFRHSIAVGFGGLTCWVRGEDQFLDQVVLGAGRSDSCLPREYRRGWGIDDVFCGESWLGIGLYHGCSGIVLP
jgi:hypothetical protein